MLFNLRDISLVAVGLTGGIGIGVVVGNVMLYYAIDRYLKNVLDSLSLQSGTMMDDFIGKLKGTPSMASAKAVMEEALFMLHNRDMKDTARDILEMWNNNVTSEYNIQ